MKRVLVLWLATLLLFSLIACGKTETPPADNGNTDTTVKPADAPADTGSSGTAEPAKGVAAWYAENGLSLPANLYYEAKISIATFKLWKIGDEFVTLSMGDYSYYRFEDGMWKEYIQDYDDTWTWMDYGDENSVVSPGLNSFVKERKGTSGKQNYYTATGETKEICGKTCMKYHEDIIGDIYVDETTGVFFELWMDGAESALQEILVWDESVTEFPIEVPGK